MIKSVKRVAVLDKITMLSGYTYTGILYVFCLATFVSIDNYTVEIDN